MGWASAAAESFSLASLVDPSRNALIRSSGQNQRPLPAQAVDLDPAELVQNEFHCRNMQLAIPNLTPPHTSAKATPDPRSFTSMPHFWKLLQKRTFRQE